MSNIDQLVQDINEEQLARDHLKYFMLYTDPMADSPNGSYELQPYHKKIIEALERVERGECKRLMISVPPQHGKSRLSSAWYPARTLGRNQYQHVMLGSYSASLSEKFSRETRELMRSDSYINLFWDILKTDAQGVEQWFTLKWGSYAATSVWGSFTGKPATKIIIDDPHKDQEEAMSPLMRNKVWDWYTSVVLSRVRDETAIVIIMTRWHEDDLCWRLLEKEAEEREVLNIPIYNEDWTVIRPQQHPKELVEKKRATIWEAMFQAMYMGDPINEWGWDFKSEYFQYYERYEVFDDSTLTYKRELDIVTFIDPAISQQQRADSTTITTIWLDRKSNNIYLLDLRRGKWLPDQIIQEVFEAVSLYNPWKVGIEINQYQKMLELEIKKEMRRRNTFFVLEGIRSNMNKEAKIKTVLQNRYSNLSILHPKRGKNVIELESELLKFPNGKHDDCIDGLSMAIMMLQTYTSGKKKSKVVRGNWN
jgi:predicted phage terminase large subunit-like protein